MKVYMFDEKYEKQCTEQTINILLKIETPK